MTKPPDATTYSLFVSLDEEGARMKERWGWSRSPDRPDPHTQVDLEKPFFYLKKNLFVSLSRVLHLFFLE